MSESKASSFLCGGSTTADDRELAFNQKKILIEIAKALRGLEQKIQELLKEKG